MGTQGKRGSSAIVASVLALLVVLAAFALAACGGSNTTTSPSPSVEPSPAATAGATQTTTPAAQEIRVFRDVRFMAERKADRPPLLDVYAPKQAGPWPLVVMLPGGFESKDSYMAVWATITAERGAVVYVPNWIRIRDIPPTAKELHAVLVGMIGDIAAAVRFARGTGARYGGDPGNLTLFGHSGGAMGATMESFSRAPASKGALKGAGSTIPESLVVFDGDYLLAQQDPWDAALEEDPGIMRVYTPWHYLGRRVDFPVTVIGSGDPNLSRELGDPWATDSWFVVRDPSGKLRRGLEGLGDLKYVYLNEDMLRLFVQRLKAVGDAVTYVRLTDSTHGVLGEEGMESLLDALVPSTQP